MQDSLQDGGVLVRDRVLFSLFVVLLVRQASSTFLNIYVVGMVVRECIHRRKENLACSGYMLSTMFDDGEWKWQDGQERSTGAVYLPFRTFPIPY
jgi:hypothetical protein